VIGMASDQAEPRIHTIEVTGARLHVESRGDGPRLLLLGGMAGGGGLAALTPLLAEHYTVITHDRRGIGHSTAVDPDAQVEIATDADDVAALIAALTAEPVLVAGTSNGAVCGLDLAIRHPERVRGLLAHEPPLPGLLSPEERTTLRDGQAHVDAALRAGDPTAAAARLAALTGMPRSGPVPSTPNPQLAARAAYLARVALALHRYQLDVDALSRTPARIVPGAGAEDRDHGAYRSAVALAALRHVDLVEFPGGHAGFVTRPDEFADRLIEVLTGF